MAAVSRDLNVSTGDLAVHAPRITGWGERGVATHTTCCVYAFWHAYRSLPSRHVADPPHWVSVVHKLQDNMPSLCKITRTHVVVVAVSFHSFNIVPRAGVCIVRILHDDSETLLCFCLLKVSAPFALSCTSCTFACVCGKSWRYRTRSPCCPGQQCIYI